MLNGVIWVQFYCGGHLKKDGLFLYLSFCLIESLGKGCEGLVLGVEVGLLHAEHDPLALCDVLLPEADDVPLVGGALQDVLANHGGHADLEGELEEDLLKLVLLLLLG